MTTTAPAIVFVILIWWISTGIILRVARGLETQMPGRLVIMTIACAAGFAGVIVASAHSQVWTIYLAFFSSILIWGWVEFTLLAGFITGPVRVACPRDVTERQRFVLAFKAIAHHEYMLVIMLVALAFADASSGSGMALKTFALLWIMRLGAKLTIFSGAPELSIDMMPERLSYLKSYFRHDRISLAFWLSSSMCAFLFSSGIYALVTVDYAPVIQVQVIMLTTLVGLGLLEHLFMILPVADSRLWNWAVPQATQTEDKTSTSTEASSSSIQKNEFSLGGTQNGL